MKLNYIHLFWKVYYRSPTVLFLPFIGELRKLLVETSIKEVLREHFE